MAHRLWRSAALMALVVCGCTRGPAEHAKLEPSKTQALVSGQVIGDGLPLAGAWIKAAVPATDMRLIRGGDAELTILAAETDEAGNYSLLIPAANPVTVSFDVFMPHFGSAAGTFMQGNPVPHLTVSPGNAYLRDFTLTKAHYLAGTVVDETNQPIPGVTVHASLQTRSSSGGIGSTTTDERGRFEIFDYPLRPDSLSGNISRFIDWLDGTDEEDESSDSDGPSWGRIYFWHPSFVEQDLADIYSFGRKKSENLRIVLATGHSLSGRLEDVAGKPVPRTLIEITVNQRWRKAALTADNGSFALKGLPTGQGVLRAHAMSLGQKIQVAREIDRDFADAAIRLEAVELTSHPAAVEILGMKLATANSELRQLYDLPHEGVVILEAQPETSRLGIGELNEGDEFLWVGEERVKNVRQFCQLLLAETLEPAGDSTSYECRVVYAYRRVHGQGTNTQRLELTREDRRRIEECLAELE